MTGHFLLLVRLKNGKFTFIEVLSNEQMSFNMKKTHKNDFEKKGKKLLVPLGVGTTRRRVVPPFLKT